MKCFFEIEYNLFIAIIALFVAILALTVSYKAIRYQIISLLNAQLADKSKECNSNLNSQDLSKPPRSIDKVSGLLSAIITAEELLNYQVCNAKNIFLWGLNVQSLIDQFYLQLHTTIRIFLEKDNIKSEDLDNPTYSIDFQNQFNRSKEFLSKSIMKNKDKKFERLHECSIERNKNK